jgi:tetratricopeptide (TPR) repeat protein
LQDVFSDDPDSAAAQIARHLDLAGNPEQAVTWYQRAADTAVRLHADADAVRMLERGIAVLRTAGPSFPSRLSRELDVLTALPGPLASAEGYLSPRLEAVHERALALGAKLGAEPTAPLLRSLALAALSRGDFGAARRAAEELTAKGGGDDVLAVEGAYVQGVAAFWLGELTAARACFETALERYRPEQRPAHLLRYAQDPQVVCLSRLAHTLWHLGDENGAARTVAEALARGRELGHPFTLSLALVFATMLAVESGNVDEVRTRLADLAAIGGDAPLTRLPTEAFAGYLTVVDGQVAEGLVRIESALADQERAAAPGLPALLQRTLLAAATVAGDAGRARRAAGELLAGNVRLWDTVARNAVTAQWNAGGTPGT